jgi:nucleotide-binding universal stress UspA family protein
MFQRSVICTDLTDGINRLTQFVPSLAANGMRNIKFLHVIPVSSEQEIPRLDNAAVERVKASLSAALKDVPAGVEVTIDVPWGKPSEQISSAAKASQADLVILGIPTRSRLDDKLFGSTTLNLCKQITTPVLTLRPQLISTYTTEELTLRCQHLFLSLLLAYNGSESSDYLVQRIKHYAQQPTSTLKSCVLAWVVEVGRTRGYTRDYQLQQAEEKLAAVKQELESVGLTVETVVREGEPIVEMLAIADYYDIRAIATSSGTLGRPLGWTVSSFTEELLRRSWHPVLYLPYPRP